jgi:hypothetical protein
MVRPTGLLSAFILSALTVIASPDPSKRSQEPPSHSATKHHGKGWYKHQHAHPNVTPKNEPKSDPPPAPESTPEPTPEPTPTPEAFISRSTVVGGTGIDNNNNKHNGGHNKKHSGKKDKSGEASGTHTSAPEETLPPTISTNNTVVDDPSDPVPFGLPTALPAKLPDIQVAVSQKPLSAPAGAPIPESIPNELYTRLPTGPECIAKDANGAIACAQKGSSHIVLADATIGGKGLELTLPKGCTFTIRGNVTFDIKDPKFRALILHCEADCRFTGNPYNKPNVHGVIDGLGSNWWDGRGEATAKPKLLQLEKFHGSSMDNLIIKNSPVQMMCISESNNVVVFKVTFDNTAGSDSPGHRGLAHNTDVIDINRSQHIHIYSCIARSQDDFVSANDVDNLVIIGNLIYETHGVAIGPQDANQAVSNVFVYENRFVKSMWAFRIKLKKNKGGSVKNTYFIGNQLFEVHDSFFGLYGNYEGGTAKGAPTSRATVQNVVVEGNSGTATNCAEIEAVRHLVSRVVMEGNQVKCAHEAAKDVSSYLDQEHNTAKLASWSSWT